MLNFAQIGTPKALTEWSLVVYVAIVSTAAVSLGAVLGLGSHPGKETWATVWQLFPSGDGCALAERPRARSRLFP